MSIQQIDEPITQLSDPTVLKVSRTVCPEDLAVGDYLAVSTEVIEFPSFMWTFESGHLPPDEAVRIKRASPTSGRPLEVIGICLPFLLVEDPFGKVMSLDIRQVELLKLDGEYARLARKKLKKGSASKRAGCDL